MTKRIRKPMIQDRLGVKLSGIVEIDDAVVKSDHGKRWEGGSYAVGMASRNDNIKLALLNEFNKPSVPGLSPITHHCPSTHHRFSTSNSQLCFQLNEPNELYEPHEPNKPNKLNKPYEPYELYELYEPDFTPLTTSPELDNLIKVIK